MSNHITATGNLGRDPELRFTKAGKAVITLSFAATPRTQDRETQQWEDDGEPLWLEATFWEEDAETIGNLGLSKGSKITVSGSLMLRPWQAKDGTTGATLAIKNPHFPNLPRPRRAAPPQTYGQPGQAPAQQAWGNQQPGNDWGNPPQTTQQAQWAGQTPSQGEAPF